MSSKYEKEGSLIIMDSLRGYFPSEGQVVFIIIMIAQRVIWIFMSYLEILLKQAERQRKNGVTVLSDLGSFYHYNNLMAIRHLSNMSRSLPKKFGGMNLKGFCLYHQKDFERQISQDQQAELLDCHSQNISWKMPD